MEVIIAAQIGAIDSERRIAVAEYQIAQLYPDDRNHWKSTISCNSWISAGAAAIERSRWLKWSARVDALVISSLGRTSHLPIDACLLVAHHVKRRESLLTDSTERSKAIKSIRVLAKIGAVSQLTCLFGTSTVPLCNVNWSDERRRVVGSALQGARDAGESYSWLSVVSPDRYGRIDSATWASLCVSVALKAFGNHLQRFTGLPTEPDEDDDDVWGYSPDELAAERALEDDD
jgi:hypothetical protein